MEKTARKQQLAIGKIDRIVQSINKIMDGTTPSPTETSLATKLELLETYFKEFNEVQSLLEEEASTDAASKHLLVTREQIEESYCDTAGLIKAIIKESQGMHSAITEPMQKQSAKLPTLKVPEFAGNHGDWPQFRDLFISLVDANCKLSPIEKLQYLKTSVKGTAAAVIAAVPLSNETYQTAWSALRDRFENPRRLIHEQLDIIVNARQVPPDNPDKLREFTDKLSAAHRTLFTLREPAQLCHELLIHLASSHLDQETRTQWELTNDATSTPEFKTLETFLLRRCQALELANPNPPALSNESSKAKYPAASKTHALPLAKGQESTKESSRTQHCCKICTQHHSNHQCPQLKSASVSERMALVKQHKLCFNCLGSGHSVAKCTSTTCHSCHRKHHTLLHRESESSPNLNTQTKEGPREPSKPTSPQPPTTSLTATTEHEQTAITLLATAIAVVKHLVHDVKMQCRILLDSASEASIVTETKAHVPIHGLGNKKAAVAQTTANLIVHGFHTSVNVQALIIPRITGNIPNQAVENTQWTHIRNLKLADTTFMTPSKIDILIGMDVLPDCLLNGKLKGSPGTPTALKTIFGWVLCGPIKSDVTVPRTSLHITATLNSTLKKFWEIEELPAEARTLTPEEQLCEEHYAATHSRDQTGRYHVRLPFTGSQKELTSSYRLAFQRLTQVEKSLDKQPAKKQLYDDFMHEYVTLHHMRPVPIAEYKQPEAYFLPHHGVMREESTTTKLRVVFDGSAKSEGKSLNECLAVGPKLQEDLWDIILKFRFHVIAMTADITKMYRQIAIQEQDWKYQRILWRTERTRRPQQYELTTVTYGTASAPYLAVKTLFQLAEDEGSKYPLAAPILKADFYVDDLLTGAADIPTALKIQKELDCLLMAGGFELRKWASNASELITAVPENKRGMTNPEFHVNNSVKALGIVWHPASDTISIVKTPNPITTNYEKDRDGNNCKDI